MGESLVVPIFRLFGVQKQEKKKGNRLKIFPEVRKCGDFPKSPCETILNKKSARNRQKTGKIQFFSEIMK